MKAQQIPVAMLEVCDRARVRQVKPKDGSDVVLEYAEAYQCGLITEPLDVFREKGTERYVIADGEHRLLALRRAKIKDVECRVHEGDEVAALDFAIGCNQKHGVRRTDRDKYHALVRIMETSLRDAYRTDTQLSEKIGISIATVKRYKAQWRSSDGGNAGTQKKKQEAKKTAERHTSTPVVNGSREPFQPAENTTQKPAPTRSPAKNGDSRPVAKSNGHHGVSAALIADFTHGLALYEDLPSPGEFRSALNGQLNWGHVERAHEWLTELLAER